MLWLSPRCSRSSVQACQSDMAGSSGQSSSRYAPYRGRPSAPHPSLALRASPAAPVIDADSGEPAKMRCSDSPTSPALSSMVSPGDRIAQTAGIALSTILGAKL